MRVHYGYMDGSGDFRITIDSELCDGCGACEEVCPKALFEVVEDDMDPDREDDIARIKDEVVKEVGYLCPGHKVCLSNLGKTCHEACPNDAIRHTW